MYQKRSSPPTHVCGERGPGDACSSSPSSLHPVSTLQAVACGSSWGCCGGGGSRSVLPASSPPHLPHPPFTFHFPPTHPHQPYSTCNPPHKQFLMRLEAGGVLSWCGGIGMGSFHVSSSFQGNYNLRNKWNKLVSLWKRNKQKKKTYCGPKQHNHIIWAWVTWHHWGCVIGCHHPLSSIITSSLEPEKE